MSCYVGYGVLDTYGRGCLLLALGDVLHMQAGLYSLKKSSVGEQALRGWCMHAVGDLGKLTMPSLRLCAAHNHCRHPFSRSSVGL